MRLTCIVDGCGFLPASYLPLLARTLISVCGDSLAYSWSRRGSLPRVSPRPRSEPKSVVYSLGHYNWILVSLARLVRVSLKILLRMLKQRLTFSQQSEDQCFWQPSCDHEGKLSENGANLEKVEKKDRQKTFRYR